MIHKLIYLIFIMFFIVGCGGSSASKSEKSDNNSKEKERNKKITIDNSYKSFYLGNNKNIKTKVILNTSKKDLYLVFTNSSNLTSNKPEINLDYNNTTRNKFELEYKEDFNSKILANKRVSVNSYNINDKKEFFLDKDGLNTTKATLKKIVADIETENGKKSLYIWVSNDSFDDGYGCQKEFCIDDILVNKLANKFLKSGENNDIYDYVTNIYGNEWGDVQNSNYIQNKNSIHILLTDIDNNNLIDSGTLGFFWAKDNTTYIKGSNQEIMFYIDSVIYANNSNGDYWQKEVYSTLAHELQHMINFYQKNILNKRATQTWLNELLSLATQDVISKKIDFNALSAKYEGYSLLSIYNLNSNISLTKWDGTLYSYATNASFGAFLVRNYGGAELLHNILYSDFGGTKAIEDAIKKTKNIDKSFNELLREWGVAVMLSDIVDDAIKSTFNFYGQSLKYNTINYELEAINFFAIEPQPIIKEKIDFVNSNANLFYKLNYDKNSSSFIINLPNTSKLEVTLIAK